MVKKSKVTLETNKLKQALEAGTPIAGMMGYIKITRDKYYDEDYDSPSAVFVKVKVVRLDAKNCGLEVVVQPVSGVGTFNITPCRWIDTPEDITELNRQILLTAEAEKIAKGLLKDSYLKNQRLNLDAYATTNGTPEQIQDYKDEVASRGGINKLTSREVAWLAKVVTRKVLGVTEPLTESSY